MPLQTLRHLHHLQGSLKYAYSAYGVRIACMDSIFSEGIARSARQLEQRKPRQNLHKRVHLRSPSNSSLTALFFYSEPC